jgi:hypothetical protein
MLARRSRRAHDVAGPKEGEDLPVAVLDQSNRADHPLLYLDILLLFLPLPKQCAPAWYDAGDAGFSPRGGSNIARKLGDRRRRFVNSERFHGLYAHELPALFNLSTNNTGNHSSAGQFKLTN